MHTKTTPSTFIIFPEVSLHDVINPNRDETRGLVSDWLDTIKLVFTGQQTVSQVATLLSKQHFRVRLVCEKCLQPCGDGYAIDRPAHWVARLFPAMQVGVYTAAYMSDMWRLVQPVPLV